MSDDPDLPPWRVEASRYAIDDRWLRVRADDCVTADGVRIAPFFVTEHPDWVIVVAIDAADRMLLVDQYRHGWGIVSRELPTGAIDPDDADILSAAKRELLEETGYGGGDWSLIATLAPNPANQSNRCHAILATGVEKLADPHDEPTERLRLVLLPIPEAITLARSGGIVQAMHVATLALALGDRWSGKD
ncbi:NUDIX hydrolase [Sphingomonas radiodurans]|uniref:NUDIX hydrolase n=1 Tax=Sphingomonas radiodurans TaxID=2890321 RepID=UPI001E3BFF78|nr:NUDIX hydrolase [Sphingomonas radiodurans]WBH16418.1 NUDIX hydrolase [Sphingomonas radiodurans]